MAAERSATPPEHVASAKARLSAHLARTRCKRSRARDAVVDAFLELPGHVSIDELTAIVRGRTPGIGYTTVYRALKLLEASGLATARDFGDGHTRYEQVVEGAHHDHLICTGCGSIEEFEDPTIEKLQEGVARRHGFRVESHKMELYGLCAACAGRDRAPAAATRATPAGGASPGAVRAAEAPRRTGPRRVGAARQR